MTAIITRPNLALVAALALALGNAQAIEIGIDTTPNYKAPRIILNGPGLPELLAPTQNEDGKTYSIQYGNPSDPFSLIVNMDPDPQIDFGGSVLNNTPSPQTYTIAMGSPLVMPDGNFDYLVEFSPTLIDANRSGSGAMVPGIHPTVFRAGLLGPNLFVAGLDGVGLVNPPSPSSANYSASGIGVKSGNAGFDVVVSFTLSPGDRMTYNGLFSLTPRPEPTPGVPDTASTAGLLGIVAVGFLLGQRRLNRGV